MTTTFSIRIRERCPDHLRAFVQIVFEDLNRDESDTSTTNPILLQLESLELTPIKGTCYVTGCAKRGEIVSIIVITCKSLFYIRCFLLTCGSLVCVITAPNEI